MRHARVLAPVLAAVVTALAVVAFAQSALTPIADGAPIAATAPPDMPRTPWGDATAGKDKAVICAACHGVDGNPIVEIYPRIAGQSERYIARQMALIASGERTSGAAAAMQPFVQQLSAQDMGDIGAFFASQHPVAGAADDGVIDAGALKGVKYREIGRNLYRGGDAARGIPACLACHGPDGGGNPGPPYPQIGGQYAGYLVRRLQDYQTGQTGERDRSQFEIMAQVSRNLTAQEIQALASYLQGLHDRGGEARAAGERR